MAFFDLSTNINIDFPDNDQTMDKIVQVISETTCIEEANVEVMVRGSRPIVRKGLNERLAYAEFVAAHNLTYNVQAELRRRIAKILKYDWKIRSSRFKLKFLDNLNDDYSSFFPKEDEDKDRDRDEEEDISYTS